MSNNPSVSVVMAVFNEADCLGESIESILCQSFSDFEFIIIDDFSQDESPTILEAFQGQDKRIKIIRNEKKQGLAYSLNRGLDEACGSFIARHDADDIALSTRLEIQHTFLQKHPNIFLCGGQGKKIDESGNYRNDYCVPLNRTRIEKAPDREKNCTIHPTWFFRNESYRYREKLRYSQDFDFLCRLIADGKEIINLPQLLIYYRVRGRNLAYQKRLLQTLNRVYIKEFYNQRLLSGKDNYEDFEQDSLLQQGIEFTETKQLLLRRVQVSRAFDNTGRETRRLSQIFIKRFRDWQVLISWALSFIPFSLYKKIREWRVQKLEVNRKAPFSFALFLSNGVRIEDWRNVGSLNRELALYHELNRKGWDISLFSYDRKKLDRIKKISIVSQYPIPFRGRLLVLYQWLLPIVHRKRGKKISVIMTNQCHAGWPAVWAGKIWKTPVIARCGYLFGERAESLKLDGWSIRRRISQERQVIQNSSMCIVPTPELRQWVIRNYQFEESRVSIIPNYVDTDLFKPVSSVKEYDIISVGRLSDVKHHEWLIDALEGTGLKAVIIGKGSCQEKLRKEALVKSVNIEWIDSLENSILAEYYQKSRIYINCSDWEGHPKALLEAMACGIPSIVRDSPGLKPFIEKNKAFWAGRQPSELSKVIDQCLSLSENEILALGLPEYIKDNFSLKRINEMYEEVLSRIVMEYYE